MFTPSSSLTLSGDHQNDDKCPYFEWIFSYEMPSCFPLAVAQPVALAVLSQKKKVSVFLLHKLCQKSALKTIIFSCFWAVIRQSKEKA